MQSYESLQPSVMEFLQRSIIKTRLAHAYLFEGERGAAKSTVALLFAKSLLCPKKFSIKEIELIKGQGKECNNCHVCSRIDQFNHPDLFYIKPDGLSIKKEQIQSLQEEFRKKAVESERKVYILSEADKLTNSSANSLLKYLEEPHEGTTIILLSSAVSKILPTILSRCQIISFKPLNIEHIANLLIENGVSTTKAMLLASIKRNVEEGLLLNQNEWFGSAQKIVEKIFMRFNKLADTLLIIQEEWLPHFKDREQIDLGLELLLYMFRDVLFLKIGKEESVANKNFIREFTTMLSKISENQIVQKMDAILEARKKLAANTNQQLLMEQLVIKLQEGFAFV